MFNILKVNKVLNLHSDVIKNPIVYLIIGLFFVSCSNNKVPTDEIIAKVGDKIITKDEFSNSYEFSVSILRKGNNPRKKYLNYMIDELLLANKGFDEGFNKSKYVVNRVMNRRNDDLLESFYISHVHNKVHIPDNKIIDVLKKSTIKFRLLIWPTPSLEKAAVAYDKASETDLDDYIEKQIGKLEIKNVEKKNFETDWMDFLDMRPEIFAQIKDLDIGKPSKPIKYQGGYAIFQIIDIKRDAIKSDELIAGPRRKKIEARLHNIESDSIVHTLMDSLLTPLDIRVKSKTINSLVKPLYSWVYDGIPDRRSIVENLNSLTDTSKEYLKELKNLMPEKLYTSINGTTTVEDYFNYMNYHRKVINESKNPIDLKNRLLTEIGTMIKNNTFISIAEKEGYLDSNSVVNDLKIWEEKWTYDVYRDHLIKDVNVTENEMEKYFEQHWRELPIANIDSTKFYKYKDDVYNAIIFKKHTILLNKELNKLRKQYPVWINEELLSKIKLNDETKSSQISVFTVKNFSGKVIVPTVDLQWLSY